MDHPRLQISSLKGLAELAWYDNRVNASQISNSRPIGIPNCALLVQRGVKGFSRTLFLPVFSLCTPFLIKIIDCTPYTAGFSFTVPSCFCFPYTFLQLLILCTVRVHACKFSRSHIPGTFNSCRPTPLFRKVRFCFLFSDSLTPSPLQAM